MTVSADLALDIEVVQQHELAQEFMLVGRHFLRKEA
ncbi:hypothetical protein SDC9_203594 [bioreactor metagenome]|uniref:Uncharacterized protein n=1 Tax=bioreactor metagenome TaxID=1076179 RepID=A0A645IYE0_9ZZZZ